MSGVLYGVSIGPGDPKLLTLQAVEVIEKSPIVAFPLTKGEKTLAFDIASKAVDMTKKEKLEIYFEMTRDKEQLLANHTLIAKRIKEKLDLNLDVAFLNLGDISVYSTFAYIMEILQPQGYKIIMLPGVTSFCAVAAALEISLTTMNKPLHIIPASSGISLEEALELEGTKVLMKSASQISRVRDTIIEKGLADKTQLVQNCSMDNEKIYKDITLLDDEASYFTTIIVKE